MRLSCGGMRTSLSVAVVNDPAVFPCAIAFADLLTEVGNSPSHSIGVAIVTRKTPPDF